MSVLDEGATPSRAGVAPPRRWLTVWLPLAVFVLALLLAAAVLPSVAGDTGARSWYRDRLGGSDLYALNVAFGRLVLPIMAAAAALALFQRRRQGRERHSATALQRHEWTEILTHWLNGVGIGLGLLTAAWLLRWLDRPVALQTAYVLHFLGASLTLAAVTHHLTYQLVGGGRGLLPRSRADLGNALAETVSYTGVYRGLPGVFGIQLPRPVRQPIGRLLRRLKLVPEHSGKYLATERVLSYPIWAILVGVVVLTGIGKSLHYVYPLPGGLRQTLTFLHDGSTIFLLVFLVFHVAALVLVPRNWPLLASMFTSRVSRAYASKHLPRWRNDDD